MIKKPRNVITIPSRLQIEIELFRRGMFDFITKRGDKDHIKQKDALKILTDNETVELLYGGAAGGAKSWTGCEWLMFSCLLYPGTKWFIGREELKRLRESTLITFFKVAKQHGVKKDVHFKYRSQGSYIEFQNGSRIDLLDLRYEPSDPLYERYGSVEYTGGWIEEGGETHFGAYDTLKSRIGRHLNDKYGLIRKLLITCNPKKNWLYTTFYKPAKEGALKVYQKFLQVLLGDNPHRESGYEDALLSITDIAKKQRLLFGNWEYEDDPMAFFDFETISNLWTNDFVLADDEHYLSCDIAAQGADKFVIWVWHGFRVKDIIAFDKCEPDECERTIKLYANIHKVPRSNIVYDADGLGNYLRGYLKGAVPFNNNGKPLNGENFANIKTQCYYKLAEIAARNEIYIEQEEYRSQITEELEQAKKVDNGDGKLKMVDKQTIKKLLGRSPDFSDSMAMRMVFAIKKKSSFDYRTTRGEK